MRTFVALTILTFCSQLWSQTLKQDLEEFAEGAVFKTNIHEIENLNLQKSMLPDEARPWSGSFWPHRSGSIAVRYSNSNLNENIRIVLGTNNAHAFFERDIKQLLTNLKNLTEEELGKLSPAEKYDLLVGDEEFTFTKKIWDSVKENQDHWGWNTFWTGICHGWAPASIHLPRPKKMIRLPIMNGTRMLPVYPDDIKALGSYLWANKANHGPQMFSGNRCNQKKLEIDKKTGEILPLTNFTRSADECSDVDPLAMHLITVNRIGLMKKSFVVEIDNNSPVNNHPLAGYELTFFNINTHKDGALKEAILPMPMIKNDVLKASRHPETTHVVGVKLKMILTHWKNPERRKTHSVKDDKFLEETIVYQLDLNAQGEPLKGHWRIGTKGATHGIPNFPDFIWNDYTGFKPREFFTQISHGLQVDLVHGLNSQWLPAAQKNSANMMQISNSTRLTHRLAKKKGLQKEASLMMERDQISQDDAANELANFLTNAGVPEKVSNPQLLSEVVLQLFELAK